MAKKEKVKGVIYENCELDQVLASLEALGVDYKPKGKNKIEDAVKKLQEILLPLLDEASTEHGLDVFTCEGCFNQIPNVTGCPYCASESEGDEDTIEFEEFVELFTEEDDEDEDEKPATKSKKAEAPAKGKKQESKDDDDEESEESEDDDEEEDDDVKEVKKPAAKGKKAPVVEEKPAAKGKKAPVAEEKPAKATRKERTAPEEKTEALDYAAIGKKFVELMNLIKQ